MLEQASLRMGASYLPPFHLQLGWCMVCARSMHISSTSCRAGGAAGGDMHAWSLCCVGSVAVLPIILLCFLFGLYACCHGRRGCHAGSACTACCPAELHSTSLQCAAVLIKILVFASISQFGSR